ncbi:MAG TPA: MFS transporter [Candidatus Eisenbacteria bacterium]|jgi:MFS family permease|nr:MFS transporter [Candidatus Eisenbacteria bacterium]
MPLSESFKALRYRNFRLLWAGQLISFTGSMMQNAAILWHVSLLVPDEKKGLALGMVGLIRVVPIVGLSLVSGVVADAVDRRRLMLFTQAGMAVAASALAILTFSGVKTLWPVYLLAALGTSFGSFDGPARNALIPSLVPREDLPNALGMNTIMFQAASILGPSLGGVVIATLGVAWVYALNAVSFLMVIWALLAMRDVPQRSAQERGELSVQAALDGLRFVFQNPLIRSTMLLDFFATFFSSATALLPIFAQDILHVGAHGYGALYAAPAIGAIVVGLVMVRWVDSIRRRGAVLLWAVIVYGLATVGFGLSRAFWLTFFFLAVTGAADMVSAVLRNIIRQLATPDHLRGRMTAVNMVFFLGGPQLGEMEAGLVAQGLGAPFSVVSGGIGCLIVTGWTAAATPDLRHYRKEETMPASAPPRQVAE